MNFPDHDIAAEAEHRLKNTFATIQALVRLTRKSARSVEAFADDLDLRLRTLARAHELLAASHQRASLRTLVGDQLAPYCAADSPRISIVGDDVLLVPVAARFLALAFHELATNACKHGALSTADGMIIVSLDRRFAPGRTHTTVRWDEFGGPPVFPQQHQHGFGFSLLHRLFNPSSEFGSVNIRFDPRGICVTFNLSDGCIAASSVGSA